MLVVATLSVVFAVASLLGSCYIAAQTRHAALTSLFRCCSRGGSAVMIPHQETIQRILFAISLSDGVSSACWISTQGQRMSSMPDSPARCLTAGVLGQGSFIAMSMWTAVFACATRSVLTEYKQQATCSGWLTDVIVWGLSALCVMLLTLGHGQTCGDGDAGSGDFQSAFAWEADIRHAAWQACFLWLPIITIGVCLYEYAGVLRHYRAFYASSLADLASQPWSAESAQDDVFASVDEGTAQTLHELRTRGVQISLKLNRRLLSYLLAYVVCELPGIPAALRQAFWTGEDNYADDGYLDLEESDPFVASRVLAQSLQGLANALVFAHHTGSLHAPGSWCGNLWRCTRRKHRSTMSTFDDALLPDAASSA